MVPGGYIIVPGGYIMVPGGDIMVLGGYIMVPGGYINKGVLLSCFGQLKRLSVFNSLFSFHLFRKKDLR